MSNTRTAVILAAGMGTRLGDRGRARPKGFLQLGDKPIIEESIERLRRSGIEQVIIVTGHCRDAYERLADEAGDFIRTVCNDKYSISGSMYSLYCAKEMIDGDFLLLESDLVYEQKALQSALSCPEDNCVLLSGFTNSNDEVFVEVDGNRLINMSKNRAELGTIGGELVGITRISPSLFTRMLDISERAFAESLHYDYETDCLVAAGQDCPVYCHLEPDLMWAEIDDAAHLERARSTIYPEIVKRDASLQ